MTCAAFEPGYRAGGPIRTVAHIVDQAPDDIDLTLVTRDRDLGQRIPYPGLSGQWVRRGNANIFYLSTGNGRQWASIRNIIANSPLDVLYVNSLFDPKFSVVPILAVRLGLISAKRIVIAPRGELSPGALELKATKKRFFIRCWKSILGGLNVLWHASADLEASHVRSHFPEANVVVNEDPTGLPEEPLSPTSLATHARFVFVSRISPKKNLDAAIQALYGVSSRVDYDIFGPIEDVHYWEKCQRLITGLPENVRVTYRGELTPQEVRGKFLEYDAFLFPTRGENFGHVIAESLSASCPVICTDQTPWTDRLLAGGGRVIGVGPNSSLESILAEIATSTPAVRLKSRLRSGEVFRDWRAHTEKKNIFMAIRDQALL